jgi:hypothetical protein
MKLTCDRCGKTLLLDEDVRYRVRIEVFAAYDPMEITAEDLAADRRDELRRLIEKLDRQPTGEVEDSVYRLMEYELCPSCQKEFLRDPFGHGVDQEP